MPGSWWKEMGTRPPSSVFRGHSVFRRKKYFFSGGLSLEAIHQSSESSFRDFFVKTTKASWQLLWNHSIQSIHFFHFILLEFQIASWTQGQNESKIVFFRICFYSVPDIRVITCPNCFPLNHDYRVRRCVCVFTCVYACACSFVRDCLFLSFSICVCYFVVLYVFVPVSLFHYMCLRMFLVSTTCVLYLVLYVSFSVCLTDLLHVRNVWQCMKKSGILSFFWEN